MFIFETNAYFWMVVEVFVKANFPIFKSDIESFYLILDWVGYLFIFFISVHTLIYLFESSGDREIPVNPPKQKFPEMVMSGGFVLLLFSLMILDCSNGVLNSSNLNQISVGTYPGNSERNMVIGAESIEGAWLYGTPGIGGREFFISRELDKSMMGEGAYRYSATVDNPLVVPVNTNIKLETSSLDGLNYAFKVDEINLNVPCISGEIHTKVFQIDREGEYSSEYNQHIEKSNPTPLINIICVSEEVYFNWVHLLNIKHYNLIEIFRDLDVFEKGKGPFSKPLLFMLFFYVVFTFIYWIVLLYFHPKKSSLFR